MVDCYLADYEAEMKTIQPTPAQIEINHWKNRIAYLEKEIKSGMLAGDKLVWTQNQLDVAKIKLERAGLRT